MKILIDVENNENGALALFKNEWDLTI